MPLVDISDPAVFHGAHDIGTGIREGPPGGRKEVRLKYHRAVMLPVCATRARRLTSALGLTAADAVALVGAGFGWLAECLEQEVPGITVVSLDTSAWVHAVKASPETSEIDAAVRDAGIVPAMSRYADVMAALDDGGPRARVAIENEDVSTDAARARLRRLHGAFTWAVTEQVLPWLTDAEAIALDAAMHKLASKVAHQLTPLMDGHEPGRNWKTLADWKALLPDSAIIGVGGSTSSP
ncbi:MAG: hypothetical protein ACE5KF_01095 [Kiloniellaceae bacterium]